MKKEKIKKPFYKRTWFIVLAVVLVGGAIGKIMGPADAPVAKTDEPAITSKGETSESAAPASEASSENKMARELPPIGEAAAVTRLAINEFSDYVPTYTDNLDDYTVVHYDEKSESVSGKITTVADGQPYDVFCVYEKDPATGNTTTHLLIVGNVLFKADDTVTKFLEDCKGLGINPVPYTELLDQLETNQ